MKELIFVFLFFLPWPVKHMAPPLNSLVLWNVGQGQWVTWIYQDECLHFDLGGEKKIIPQVQNLCRGLNNQIYITHWDRDHYSFLKQYAHSVEKACWGDGPPKAPFSLDFLKPCKIPPAGTYRPLKIVFRGNPRKKNKNASGFVYLLGKHWIVPGDSPASEEKHWQAQLPKGHEIRGLVLGHHGSKTSTSELLLKNLPGLKWTAVSARYQKYRHPNKNIQDRLKRHHLPLLRTEDWGHLHFLL